VRGREKPRQGRGKPLGTTKGCKGPRPRAIGYTRVVKGCLGSGGVVEGINGDKVFRKYVFQQFFGHDEWLTRPQRVTIWVYWCEEHHR
jgi:hypothetical protein